MVPLPPLNLSFADTGHVMSSVGPVTQGGLNINSSTSWPLVAAIAVGGLVALVVLKRKRKGA